MADSSKAWHEDWSPKPSRGMSVERLIWRVILYIIFALNSAALVVLGWIYLLPEGDIGVPWELFKTWLLCAVGLAITSPAQEPEHYG